MKLFIMPIAILYTFALSSNIEERKASEYCYRKKIYSAFLELKKIKKDFYIKEKDVVYLPEEYKFCKWGSRGIHAKIRLDENLVLEKSYFGMSSYDHEKYDSIFVSDVSEFYCYVSDETSFASGRKCREKNVSENIFEKECEDGKPIEKREYNDIFLPILKKSIGKIFTADMAVEVSCPKDANDANYTERKILKIGRPIVIIGECTE
jgi:hypothetical protein